MTDAARSPLQLSVDHCMCLCRGNVEDALEKLQAAVDGAVESIQPIEVDPEKEKQMKKQ